MKACKVDEEMLAEWIDGATGAIRYLGPAITERIALKITAAEKRTGQRNHVVIDLDDEMMRSGYGQIEGVRKLHDEGASIQHRKGLRMAALTAPGIGAVWSPIAERVDSIEQVTVNGIWMEGVERRELQRWMCRMIGQRETSRLKTEIDRKEIDRGHEESNVLPGFEVSADPTSRVCGHECTPVEPDVHLVNVDGEEFKRVETHLREHPPRDFKKEKETEVYQGYVGFIEIHVKGAGLSRGTTLAIPKELTELGLETDLRRRLTERMRIDLSEKVDLGAKDVNRWVDAFREIFTRQMGPPLGRIFKKSEWDIMRSKWKETERLVDVANEKIAISMAGALEKIISDAATDWAKAIARNPDVELRKNYTVEKIRLRLDEKYHQKRRPTRMKVELFVKDLTWQTLNDPDVRRKIEKAYPDLRDTGLYKSRRAWAS